MPGTATSENGISEDALAAAKRELLEETGYGSDDWCHMLTVPSNATLADNYMSIFVAKNCQKWLTGTAAWTFTNISQYILGVYPTHKGLSVDPCVPAGFGDFKLTRGGSR